MRLWQALVCGTALLVASPASACQCSEQPIIVGVWPADGREGVPTNTRIRLLVHQAPPLADPELSCDGAPVPLTATRRAGNDYQYLVELEPEDGLAPWATCRLTIENELQSTFITSDVVDHEAPSWAGDMDRGTERDTTHDACGTWETVAWVRPQGALDDTTPDAQLLFELSPDEEGPRVWGTADSLALITGDKCISMDADLGSAFRLKYDVHGYDESGNATAGHSTKAKSTGCSAMGREVVGDSGPRRLGTVLLLVVLALLPAARWRRN
jgi:hypothetical protein